MVLDMNRRAFLASVSASVTLLATVRVDQKLSTAERQTLQSIARTIFPSRADERVYEEAVNQIDRRCRLDGELFHIVTSGVASIVWTYGGQFSSQPLQVRIRVLKDVETTRFFLVIYAAFLESFFGPHDSWGMFAAATTDSAR